VTVERGFISLGKQVKAGIFPLQILVEDERDAEFHLSGRSLVIT
jgi:hypothetical protein